MDYGLGNLGNKIKVDEGVGPETQIFRFRYAVVPPKIFGGFEDFCH